MDLGALILGLFISTGVAVMMRRRRATGRDTTRTRVLAVVTLLIAVVWIIAGR